jgi:hypothetical protein
MGYQHKEFIGLNLFVFGFLRRPGLSGHAKS